MSVTSKTYFMEVYGCQMNVADSAELQEALANNHWQKAESPEQAQVIIINSCAIRQKAEDRVYGRLGYYKYLKKTQPLKLVLMGCVAQKEGAEILERFPFVDFVVGTKNRQEIPHILEQAWVQMQKEENDTEEAEEGAKIHWDQHLFTSMDVPIEDFLEPSQDPYFPQRGFLSIIHGCSKICSYCIVPRTRGPEISVPSHRLIEDAKKLTKKGVKEIYLLGQNVNSYGLDRNDIPFHELIREISLIPEVERIKFISSHPRDVTEGLFQEFQKNPKLNSNFHLALQSGSNRILENMNRQHTIEYFIEKMDTLRTYCPQIFLSTDIIVGYPGETEEDFWKTYEAMERIRFDRAYIFMYSPRPKTVSALKYADNIPLAEKQRRLDILLKKQHERLEKRLQSFVGQILHVLFERPSPKDPKLSLGISEFDVHVAAPIPENGIGNIIPILIEGYQGQTLIGTPVF